jgi:hypothetical protein
MVSGVVPILARNAGSLGALVKIGTAHSTAGDAAEAARDAYVALIEGLGASPDFLVACTTVEHDCAELAQALSQVAADTPLHGSTSCLQVMTSEGTHSEDGRALALFGIVDPGGAYGVGLAPIGNDPRAAARGAAEAALDRAERWGEVPALVWLSAAPGSEEALLAGLEDVFGPNVPVFGGSAADNAVAGDWCVFAQEASIGDGVVVSVLFPTTRIAYAFHSGYEPTDSIGRVTAASGRVVREIDGRPAAAVYDDWCEGLIAEVRAAGGGSVLERTTLSPLGRVVGEAAGLPYYQLSHLSDVLADDSIGLFTEVQEGDELTLMRGSKESLVARAGRVAASAAQTQFSSLEEIAGALVVFCAGCMLTVQDQMDQVAAGLREALGGAPLLGAFTFGEQGCFVGGENRHGNLMISTILFEAA